MRIQFIIFNECVYVHLIAIRSRQCCRWWMSTVRHVRRRIYDRVVSENFQRRNVTPPRKWVSGREWDPTIAAGFWDECATETKIGRPCGERIGNRDRCESERDAKERPWRNPGILIPGRDVTAILEPFALGLRSGSPFWQGGAKMTVPHHPHPHPFSVNVSYQHTILTFSQPLCPPPRLSPFTRDLETNWSYQYFRLNFSSYFYVKTVFDWS